METRVTPLWPHNKPDFGRLRKVFLRQGVPDRVPFIELFADPEAVAAVLGEPLFPPATPQDSRDLRQARLERRIRFCQTVGYDFVWCMSNPGFTLLKAQGDDTAELSRGKRAWVNEDVGLIHSRADFEAYPWPAPDSIDYFDIDFLSRNVPEGMQITIGSSGILEFVMWLMGFAAFSVALYDDPALVTALFERVESILVSYYETMSAYPNVGAIFLGDDMGHRTGTMIRPEHLRQYVFPRQKRLREIAHRRGLPFLLHSCGDLHLVMDDLIDDVGIDGKHSFEDTYLPVAAAKRLYGSRTAILGGVDMNLLASATEEEVRAYTRRVLEACMPGGGYAIGSGNSFANYVPVRNYLAMLDEAMQAGVYAR